MPNFGHQSAISADAAKRFAFIFPMASGHINPSLAIARSLVKLGHEVHYLCREQMREAIEDTGATFGSEIPQKPELYEGREADLFGAFNSMKTEFNLEDDPMIVAMMKLTPVMLEMQLPGTIRWLQQIRPHAVVFCPLMNLEAVFAAKIMGIPSIGILTIAGPGSCSTAMQEFLRMSGITAEEALQETLTFQPLKDSLERVNQVYDLNYDVKMDFYPLGFLRSIVDSKITLVTTCEDLQDPMDSVLEKAYKDAGVRFEAVGPLLDQPGALRAAGHKFETTPGGTDSTSHEDASESPLALLHKALAAGRVVVLVSMGTVLTGDSTDFGWHVKPQDGAGSRRGLTGRELCQAAWAGAFDAFGVDEGEDLARSPLLLVALGPQQDAQGELRLPANACCLPVLPQVDLLQAGVDLFLTHGGQNSFTESLSAGVPVVVCPGFGDQVVNARKAVAMGVGLQVERPAPEDGEEADAAATYRAEVRARLLEVKSEPAFREAAARCAKQLQDAGGVPRAIGLILEAAQAPLPVLLGGGGLAAVATKPVLNADQACHARPL